jgi:hypothetical protein
MGADAMNNTFKISLGIAAVDCLISAFVAVLVVTLSIIGSAEQESALDVSKIVALSVRKSDVVSGQMKVRLLLVVELSKDKLIPFAPNLTRTDLVPLPGLEGLTKGGRCSGEIAFPKTQRVPRNCWCLNLPRNAGSST